MTAVAPHSRERPWWLRPAQGAWIAAAAITLQPAHVSVAFVGVGIGVAFHAVSHVVDRDLGGDPAVDIPLFAVIALLVLGAAVARSVTGRSR